MAQVTVRFEFKAQKPVYMCFFSDTLLLLLEIKIMYKNQSLRRHITKEAMEPEGCPRLAKEDRVKALRGF